MKRTPLMFSAARLLAAATLAIFAGIPAAQAQNPSLEALVAAAKQEGELTLIAAARDWCGVGELIDTFKAKYGIRINELNPDASSGVQVEAIKANKGNTSSQAPDTINVGLSFAQAAKEEGLTLPFRPSTWETIPERFKDKDHAWAATYFGALSFVVNTDIIKNPPLDWADLLKPEYKNAVALSGDPRASSQSLQSVIGAGASFSNGDLAKAGQAGLDFFIRLKQVGNFVPVAAKAASLAQGTTPISIRWDYLGLMDRDILKGNPPVEVIVPRSGVVVGPYAQAISAHAPHPNAAKLWVEHIFSDEGQLIMLKGYCRPIRFDDLSARGKIPADLLARLPQQGNYRNLVLPTTSQAEALKDTITKGWETVVATQGK